MFDDKTKYIIRIEDKTLYLQSCKYLSLVDDRLISNFFQMKVNKYRNALITYGGKLIQDQLINNKLPKNYTYWNEMNISKRWRIDKKAVYFEKEEDAQNALDWLESILLAKTLFKK